MLVASFLEEDISYKIVSISEGSRVIEGCSFACYENSCAKTALKANNCLNTKWIAFIPTKMGCTLFPNKGIKTSNYTVFGITVNDDGINPIENTFTEIDYYFEEAVNYGCKLLTNLPNADWFGLIFQSY